MKEKQMSENASQLAYPLPWMENITIFPTMRKATADELHNRLSMLHLIHLDHDISADCFGYVYESKLGRGGMGRNASPFSNLQAAVVAIETGLKKTNAV